MNAAIIRYGQQDHVRQRILTVFFLLLVTGFFLIGCGEKADPGSAQVKRQTISGVSIATLTPASIDEFYEAVGTVKADHTSTVASRMMGTVTSLLVKEGDTVEKGQLLLTLDDRDVVQKVKAAEAGYQEATKALESVKQNRELTGITYERYRKMFEEKAISRQEMDQFETQKKVAGLEHERVQEMVNRAAAGLSEAKIFLGFTRVTSPIKGRVTEKKIEVGSMAVPGMPLLTLEDIAAFHAEVTVDESLSGKLRTGMPVLVSIEAIDRQMTGENQGDPSGRRFPVPLLHCKSVLERRRAEKRPLRPCKNTEREKRGAPGAAERHRRKGTIDGRLCRGRSGNRHLPPDQDRQGVRWKSGNPVGSETE